MFREKLNCKVKIYHQDDQGVLLLEVKVKDLELLIGSIYAPNEDQPNFFQQLVTNVKKSDMAHIILGGDFNLTMDNWLDRRGSEHNHWKSSETLKNLMAANEWEDVWRILHPDKKSYTWSHTKPMIHYARLDFVIFVKLPELYLTL